MIAKLFFALHLCLTYTAVLLVFRLMTFVRAIVLLEPIDALPHFWKLAKVGGVALLLIILTETLFYILR